MKNTEIFMRLHFYEQDKKTNNVFSIRGTQARVVVGRQEDCDVKVSDSKVSRKHCEILIINESVVVKDLESLGGTYLNEKLVGSREHKSDKYVYVEDGDCIRLSSDTSMYVECIRWGSRVEKVCAMCGKSFVTSNVEEEFCIDCRCRMAKDLGLQRNRELQLAHVFWGDKVNEISAVEPKAQEPKVPKPVIKPDPENVAFPGYKKIKELGRNDSFLVYQAEEQATGKQVAIKIARKARVYDAAIKGACDLQRQLSDKYTVKVHKDGVSGGLPYMVMDYYKGGTIADYYKAECSEEINQYIWARYLLMDLLLSLQYLHCAKLIPMIVDERGNEIPGAVLAGTAHLNLKPNNILVEPLEELKVSIKIADFGMPEHKRVTPEEDMEYYGYKPKAQIELLDKGLEQYCLKSVDRVDWDVWAAVAITYHMLTGHFPKPLENGKDMKATALNEKVTPIWVYDWEVPVEFARILDLALKDDGELYYKSARQLILDLQKIKF